MFSGFRRHSRLQQQWFQETDQHSCLIPYFHCGRFHIHIQKSIGVCSAIIDFWMWMWKRPQWNRVLNYILFLKYYFKREDCKNKLKLNTKQDTQLQSVATVRLTVFQSQLNSVVQLNWDNCNFTIDKLNCLLRLWQLTSTVISWICGRI